ncbi:ParB/RepB/Spo0J family partition protein [Patescibacteria group bacterium]|nr:ParB/RepB/Spo0J family partition protein [Patescibacteria group bacterium]
MLEQNSGLGRGLDALLPDTEDDAVTEVAIAAIEPMPDQPRGRFPERELLELAHSIRQHGLLQPLVVTESQQGKHQLIAGERRWRAAKLAGLSNVPVVIRSADEQRYFELALIENLQRSDLSPIEEAKAYTRLMETGHETQEALAKRLGKSRSRIAQMVRLLNLSAEMQAALEQQEITTGHAQALLSQEGQMREQLFRAIKEKNLTVRQAESWGTTIRAPKIVTEKPSWLHQLELDLGLKIDRQGSNEKGALTIRYHSGEQLEQLVKRLAGKDGG